jgi:cyclopropane-fatty-acyl-phospholipid synthase
MFFARLLDRLICCGDLTYVDGRGHRYHFGGAPVTGIAPVTIRLHDRRLDLRLALRPLLAVGEAYMEGQLTIEQGSLYDFIALACHNIQQGHRAVSVRTAQRFDHLWRGLQHYNPLSRSRQNAAHHYDLSLALYDLFLDSDHQYSCAYFERPDDSLEQAQLAKKRHIMAKLLLRPGLTLLDVGCGWGGLALTMAREAGVDVTGITLSEQQWAEAERRAAAAGRSEQVRFRLTDYRQVEGSFDRIVSVGMFEHVGPGHFDDYFKMVYRCLAPDGVALIHFISRADGPGTTNPWMRKYIFPGGYSPALSEVLPAIERNNLFVTDIEILRLHYAETLRAWRQRFQANRPRAAQRYDERFCRMWEFYLAGAEVAFRFQGHIVAQVQLTRSIEALPLTRDYMFGLDQPALRQQAV